MSNKAKGTRAEHKTMRWLEAEGFSCTRAAASLGAWDVIAIRKDAIRLVQVKCNRRPGSVEMEVLNSFEVPPQVSKEVWVWKDRARQPIVEVL